MTGLAPLKEHLWKIDMYNEDSNYTLCKRKLETIKHMLLTAKH